MTITGHANSNINSASAFLSLHNKGNPGSIKRNDIFLIPLELLEEEEGFNVRDYTRPEIIEHIEDMALAYERGEQLPPLQVKIKNGRCLVRDGHCRRRSALKAKKRGVNIERLPCIEFKGDEIEQDLLILNSNKGLRLTSIERATVYKKMAGWGLSPQDIALKVNKTDEHVRQQLFLLELPVELKNMINNDVISASLAVKYFKEYGHDAVNIIKKAHEEINEPAGSVAAFSNSNIQLQLAADPDKPVGAEDENQKNTTIDPKQRKVTEKALANHIGKPKNKITKKVMTRIQASLRCVAEQVAACSSTLGEESSVQVVLTRDAINELLELKALLESTQSDNNEEGNAPAANLSEEQLSLLGEESIIDEAGDEHPVDGCVTTVLEEIDTEEQMNVVSDKDIDIDYQIDANDEFNQDNDNLMLSIIQDDLNSEQEPMYG